MESVSEENIRDNSVPPTSVISKPCVHAGMLRELSLLGLVGSSRFIMSVRLLGCRCGEMFLWCCVDGEWMVGIGESSVCSSVPELPELLLLRVDRKAPLLPGPGDVSPRSPMAANRSVLA